MNIWGLGVFFSGKSGIGKSELALTLLDRGHALIADDMVEFSINDAQELWGCCPQALQNLLEIRGLGIFNVEKLYSPLSLLPSQKLSLVIHLEETTELDRSIEGFPVQQTEILDIPISLVKLEFKGVRPLAVLTEVIVRQKLLNLTGQTAIAEFTMTERILA